MEKNKKALLFTLVLLLGGMFLLTSVFASENDNQKTPQRDSSYKVVQTYNEHNNERINLQVKPVQTFYLNKQEYAGCGASRKDYYSERTQRNFDSSIHYTRYSTESTRKSFLGDYVKEYSVDVRNTEKTGRYFTVIFEFEDKDGFEFSQSVTQYLRTEESKKFVYKDIQYERNEILDWDYTIIAQK
jgi:hypothetical protein